MPPRRALPSSLLDDREEGARKVVLLGAALWLIGLALMLAGWGLLGVPLGIVGLYIAVEGLKKARRRKEGESGPQKGDEDSR